ncbi:MAG: hypothetical protein E6X17_07585 [Sporomusaceae bacterium]|nr:hypothetical protein [Sporomusaceae bacterium]
MKAPDQSDARTDQPLAHEAGVNHALSSAGSQTNPRNLRTANYIARTMLWEQQEKVDADDIDITEENTIEIRE